MAVDKKDFGADEPSSPGGAVSSADTSLGNADRSGGNADRAVDKSGPLDLSDPDAVERRNRRKRAGLRVPSDNVPRPQGASDSRRIVTAEASASPAPQGAVAEARESSDLTEPDLEVDVDLADDVDDARVGAEEELAGEDVNIEDTPVPTPIPTPPKSGPVNGAAVAAAASSPAVSAPPAAASPPPASAASSPVGSSDVPLSAAETQPKRPTTDPPDLVEEISAAELEEVPSGPHKTPPPVSTPPVATSTPPAPPVPPPATPAAATAGSTPSPITAVPAPKRPQVAPPQPPPDAGKTKPAAAAAAAAAAAVAEAKPKKRKTRAWFEEIFDDDYLRTLPFLTPQATQAEAAFIADGLAVKPGQQLLDLGCGYGRHAMELAARGYHMVALDLSLPLLIRGADEAQRRGLNINFVHGDMRELTFDTQFDGAYCVFSTFGYFDDEMNKRVAQNAARALKPGARLIVDVLNRDYIIADLPTRVWWEGDGCVVLEEVDFNYYTSRMVSNRSVVFEDGRQLEQEISIRSYSLHELGKLLHQAGFRVIEVSGSLAARGRFFGGVSRQIIVIAERRPNEAGREPSSPNLDVLRDPANKSGGAGGSQSSS